MEGILNFNPVSEGANRPVHNVPILLSFLCLLVREDNIDLSSTNISMGEIYYRMVCCLYRKFTIRKGIEFDKNSLVHVLMSLGKLALETVLSGNPLLERSQIIEQVGEDVFEYGLLIGKDGFSLTRKMTVDIIVTFPHRSLQEFLGTFYFVLSLGKNQPVNDVDNAFQKYLKNTLFLEFCLWLSDESVGFFPFPERAVARQKLNNYVTKQIDAVEVDFQKIESKYPVLSLALGDKQNETAFKILEGALVKCSMMKHIVIEPHHPIDRILRSMPSFIVQRLNSIKISNFQKEELQSIKKNNPLQFLCLWHDCSLNLTVNCDLSRQPAREALSTVLKVAEGWNRTVNLCVTWGVPEKSSQAYPSVYTFSIDRSYHMQPTYKMYPQLVNLFLTDSGLNSKDMSLLAQTSAQGRLPNLSTLDISGNHDIGANLSELLSQCFPSLHTLILSRCRLEMSDVHSLTLARREARLPQLRHLDVSFNCYLNFNLKLDSSESLLPLLFQQGILSLHTLVVRECPQFPLHLYTSLPQVRVNSEFPTELTVLDMSYNLTIEGSLSALMCHYFPHLQILVLRCCNLNINDLLSLAEASSHGRLPELRHLDMSQNYIGMRTGGLFRLFAEHSVFPSLINLILCDCFLQLPDLCCLTQAKLDGKLPRIRHLDISFNRLSGHAGILSRDPFTQREISWGNVICYEKLYELFYEYSSDFGFIS